MVTSKSIAGVVLIGALATNGRVVAQSRAVEVCVECQVAFDVSSSADGIRLKATAGDGTIVEKRVNRDGLFTRVTVSGDEIRIVSRADGKVVVTRRAQAVTVRPDSTLAEHDKVVRQLVHGSAAVQGLERMIRDLRNDDRPESLSVLATFALLRSLQGDTAGNELLAQRTPRRKSAGFLQVKQAPNRGDGTTVGDCYAEYEYTLSINYSRYSKCLTDFWWAQPIQYACALEWAMVAELAMFRLIACVGGFPIR